MPRPVNAIDFWRGFALVSIFINHIPGIYFSNFTHARYSLSDSADLFVFLAGWSVRLLLGSGDRQMPTKHVVFRLGGRALQIYAAQILIAMLAIGMLAAAAMLLANPLLLEWHNAASVFYDPVPTHVGLMLVTHQLGYFDILPLYVVLMLMAPVIAVVHRTAPQPGVLILSAAVYCITLAIPIRMPTWPVEGQWFFNPLAWQFIFVLGFVLARDEGLGAVVRRHIVPIRIVGLVLLVVIFVIQWNNWWYDPTKVPQPRLFFLLDKTYLTPIRLIQFLSLVAVFSIAFPTINRAVPRLVEFFCLLGRNSLEVFCVGSLLSLAAQIVRFASRGYFGVDVFVVITGVAIMTLTAWLSEWRDRARKPVSGGHPPSS
jgi:hypothetical protein